MLQHKISRNSELPKNKHYQHKIIGTHFSDEPKKLLRIKGPRPFRFFSGIKKSKIHIDTYKNSSYRYDRYLC